MSSAPQEARQRNPDVVLYGLPWGEPGWINNQQGYYAGNDSITYQLSWLQCARDTHNLTVDWLVRAADWLVGARHPCPPGRVVTCAAEVAAGVAVAAAAAAAAW